MSGTLNGVHPRRSATKKTVKRQRAGAKVTRYWTERAVKVAYERGLADARNEAATKAPSGEETGRRKLFSEEDVRKVFERKPIRLAPDVLQHLTDMANQSGSTLSSCASILDEAEQRARIRQQLSGHGGDVVVTRDDLKPAEWPPANTKGGHGEFPGFFPAHQLNAFLIHPRHSFDPGDPKPLCGLHPDQWKAAVELLNQGYCLGYPASEEESYSIPEAMNRHCPWKIYWHYDTSSETIWFASA